MHQETLKIVLPADTSSVTVDFDLKGKTTRQLQLYPEKVIEVNSFNIMITDVSETALLKKQPIENLRSRDGGYDNNCPFVVKQDKVKVLISSSKAVTEDTIFTLVVDVEGEIVC